MKKYCVLAFIGILSLGGLLSCGLETVYYMDYIRRLEISETNAVIRLPSNSDEGYGGTGVDGIQFDNFIIFYRIYISDSNIITGRQLEGYGTNNDRSAISSTLNSDYNALYSYTDITSTSVNTSNLETTFSNRRYFLLTLANVDINSGSILGSVDSSARRLEIAFPTNDRPTLTINNGTPYDLQRAIKNENLNLFDLNPLPNRIFLNDPELYNTVNVTNGRNADVATLSGSGTPQYTYVSMYIAARGTNIEMPPGTVYSQPTFIGIFRLAESGG